MTSIEATKPASLLSVRLNVGPGFVVVLATYAVVFIAIILAGHGLPYVMDNNETFSSLNHAYNLWHFNFWDSLGLTDEAASPSVLAHPMIHTHQGNFPRLFSFFLYVLGARSAEAQILITTFTVGIASVSFGFLFFRRLAGELFATIAMALLMTDYLLFAQWQVDTYRVWSGFLLFGILLTVQNATRWSIRHWTVATVLLYAALFYGELVFAAFVSVGAAVFALLSHWRRWTRIVSIWAVSGLGALVGIGTLASQLLLFMGWRAAFRDFELTLSARNYASSNVEFFQELNKFYSHHNVIFLNNIVSADRYSGPLNLLQSAYRNTFQLHSPVFCLASLSLVLALYLSDRRGPSPADTEVASGAIDRVGTVIVALGLFSFLCSIGFLGAALVPGRLMAPSLIGKISFLAVIAAAAVPLSVGIRRLAALASPTGTVPALHRCARGAVYLVGCSGLASLQDILFDGGPEHAWLSSVLGLPVVLSKAFVIIAALIGLLVVLGGRRTLLGHWRDVPERLLPLFISGLIAYCFVYLFSGGYLETGYLVRLAPLPVFHADALLALGPFLLAAVFVWAVMHGKRTFSRSRKVIGCAIGGFCVGLLAIWSLLQYRLQVVAPPNQFSFVQFLQPSLADGRGLVSNNYAAPFGYVARTWAYTDPLFGITGNPPGKRHPVSYLWFADRGSNDAYFKPGLFVCFEGLSTLPDLIYRTQSKGGRSANCSGMPMVRQAFSNLGSEEGAPSGRASSVRLVPIARDEVDGRWAIVKLDWQH